MERRKAVPWAAALAVGSMTMAAGANLGSLSRGPAEPVLTVEPAASDAAVPVTAPSVPPVEIRYEDMVVPVPATPQAAAAAATAPNAAARAAAVPGRTAGTTARTTAAATSGTLTTTTFDDHDDDDDSGRGRGRGRSGDDDGDDDEHDD